MVSVDVAGAEVTFAATTKLVSAAKCVAVMVVSDVAPIRAGDEVPAETAVTAACEGTTDIKPKPKAETATSATRLRVVFVDICFLSIVDPRAFPGSAWLKKAHSYVMRRHFWAGKWRNALSFRAGEGLALRAVQASFSRELSRWFLFNHQFGERDLIALIGSYATGDILYGCSVRY